MLSAVGVGWVGVVEGGKCRRDYGLGYSGKPQGGDVIAEWRREAPEII